MIYVVSDLHGSNKKFQRLLKEINFTDRDMMYVLGDIVDYGEDSIGLLCVLPYHANRHEWLLSLAFPYHKGEQEHNRP